MPEIVISEIVEADKFNQEIIIKVVGVGGAGGNAINHMIRSNVRGVEFISANTDAQALSSSGTENRIQLGQSGLGAGANPEVGKEGALENRELIENQLRGAKMVFITAGMGGGTGTGAAPVFASIARSLGILTVAVVTRPFEFEGTKRSRAAEAGLAELLENVDSLIIVHNDKLHTVMDEDATMEECFMYADNVLKNAVSGISEIINVEGNMNVDFEDLRTVMKTKGKAMMGMAEATGPDRARMAAQGAITSPLLEGVDLAGAQGLLINITAGRTLKLRESREIADMVRASASVDAAVILGTAYDDTLGETIRVTVVATGLGEHRDIGPRSLAPSAAYASPVTTGTPVPRKPEQPAFGARTNVASLPSVWRSARADGGIASVASPAVTPAKSAPPLNTAGTLSSGVTDYEVPAFLRKDRVRS